MEAGKDKRMQIKLFGALCIVVGGGGFGFLMASYHKKTIHMLKELISILEIMECELKYRCTPLPQLCRYAVRNRYTLIGNLFSQLADELDSQISPDTERCMAAVLERNSNLDKHLQKILEELGMNIGRFNLDGQIRGLEYTKATCYHQLKDLEHNKDHRLRSYQTLGLCAGTALAILLI